MKNIFILGFVLIAMFLVAGCCESGSRKCGSGDVWVCEDGAWTYDKMCSNGCSDGFCNPPCSDYQYECIGEDSYVCWDEHWWVSDECEAGCNESTGRCNAESPNDRVPCDIPGSYRCKSNMLQKCDEGEWQNIQECGGGQICSQEEKRCVTEKTEEPVPAVCETVGGRTWSPRAPMAMYWEDAVAYCNNLTDCGYTDWHMPTISELRTLIRNCSATETGSSSCNPESSYLYCHCSGCSEDNSGKYSKLGDAYWYWSSTMPEEYIVCGVYFSTGEIGIQQIFTGGNVRCVR